MGESVAATRRSFQRILQIANGSQPNAIKALYEKFKRTVSFENDNVGTVKWHLSVFIEANVQVIEETTVHYSRKSVQKTTVACQLN